jgi:hypothetical protein
MCSGSVLWCFQVVMVAVLVPMAGLESRNGDDNGQTGEKLGPVEVLGRADTAAGRRRGGKPPERPPAGGPAPQADAAAVRQELEGGAGFRCGPAAAGAGTVCAAGSRSGQSRWRLEAVGDRLCGCWQSGCS